jgi:hypothetical protein
MAHLNAVKLIEIMRAYPTQQCGKRKRHEQAPKVEVNLSIVDDEDKVST